MHWILQHPYDILLEKPRSYVDARSPWLGYILLQDGFGQMHVWSIFFLSTLFWTSQLIICRFNIVLAEYWHTAFNIYHRSAQEASQLLQCPGSPIHMTTSSTIILVMASNCESIVTWNTATHGREYSLCSSTYTNIQLFNQHLTTNRMFH